MITEMSVGSIIFFENQLLLLKYKTKKGDKFYWDFPKGHPEKKESKEKALKREVKEETNLDISIIKGFSERAVYFFRQKDELVKKTVIFSVSVTESKDVKISKEHYDFMWTSPKEALMLVKHPASKKILKAAVTFYESQKRLSDF
ncbi:MAG: NUDIX domain-containing protein [Candidatus Altiarchaeota archaeon]|nr:NUDIX domain-containing protein [Candidatus Altiarchaeota archaeon]